jgi:hypothetical protein
MKRNSKVRYWQASIALALFGALAACSSAGVEEDGNVNSAGAETSDNVEQVTAESSSELSSGVQTPSVRKCDPYWVCCEPLPGGACNLCRRDYRYCP